MVFHIPSKQSASFYFNYSIKKPKEAIKDCKAWLVIEYIDPETGDKGTFKHPILDESNLIKPNMYENTTSPEEIIH